MGPKKKPQKGNQQGGPVKMTRKEKALAKKIERGKIKLQFTRQYSDPIVWIGILISSADLSNMADEAR